MKLAWIIALAGISTTHAQPPVNATARGLTVYVIVDPRVPANIRLLGEGVASQIFQGLGIRLEWRRGSTGDAVGEPAMRLQYKIGCEDSAATAAGAACPYEGFAVVCYDRLRWAEHHPILGPQLLGHVLAHEIAHNLQGVARHSKSGIMKAQWTARDYNGMSLRSLPFEPEDIELIRRGFDRKSHSTDKSMAISACTDLLGIR